MKPMDSRSRQGQVFTIVRHLGAQVIALTASFFQGQFSG
jgi:hypothetical protein